MKACVLRAPGKVECAEVPLPTLPPDWVLMRVESCGVCGSDLRYFRGENPWALHTLGVAKPNPPNMILGHEVAGVLADVGKNVDRSRVGERVVALAFKACGECTECQRGRPNLCPKTQHLGHSAGWEGMEYNPGGMAEFCPVWADNALRLPPTVSFDEAAFIDGLGVAVHAVHRAKVRSGDSVCIAGCGPIGLCVMQVAKAHGAQKAICIDIYDKALELAAELGGDIIIDAREADDLRAAVLDYTSGRGVDALFDSTGDLKTQSQTIRALAPGGSAILLAGAAEGLKLDTPTVAGERLITTSANNLPFETREAIELVERGAVRVAPMITHRFPLERVAEAFEVMAAKAEHRAFKVIIRPQE